MNIKKSIFWVSGTTSALLVLAGIGAFICPEMYTKILGGVIAALSLCFGILTALPVFAMGLILGIAMIFLPKTVGGILLVVLGVVGMIVCLIVGVKLCKKSGQAPSAQASSNTLTKEGEMEEVV